ncbi:MAG: polyprenyl synthetase family protein [Brevefilum sp.]|nr:polyprenyl synthetase family protein [Brevefilum sp.]MDW7755179.1 polyprenyl synthetase family protein [Brevefilum sp.]
MILTILQKQLLPEIENRLKYFLQSLNFGQSLRLYEMISYHMGWEDEGGSHGKRIRPFLSLLCAGALNGSIQNTMPGAVAIEYLHNFTLIHDDIEDNSPIRHGRPTLWQKWGLAQAVNAGDALFSIAQLSILSLNETCDEVTALKASKAFNHTCLHLTRGQYLDIAFESSQDIDVSTYFDMIGGKTAALIGFSTYLGGLTAHVGERQLELLEAFGSSLGMAFQIQDDYLGIWGDPHKTGKSAATDLLTRKKSLPILFGLKHSKDFKNIWNKEKISAENVDTFAKMLVACGAQDFIQAKAQQYTEKAFKALHELFPTENEYIKALNELTETLLNRNS